LVAALGIALALPALAFPAPNSGTTVGRGSQSLSTETTLNTQIRDLGGSTKAILAITVAGEDGVRATGPVVIEDAGKPLAGVALDATGHASATVSLLPGEHSLSAVYLGDPSHQASVSQLSPVRAQAGSVPGFKVSASPTTLFLAQGVSGSVVASVLPVNSSSLTAPMFVTLSCSGLPDQSSCTFTPENIEIVPNETAAIPSTMVLATSAGSAARSTPPVAPNTNRVDWAVLLPGALGLAGLAFGIRRRPWLCRLCLLALVGLVSVLGTTACSPLYNYHNHGPPHNLPTPVGTYTVSINAQSSNGITATTESVTIALTVQ
jgi:hypothetical protein